MDILERTLTEKEQKLIDKLGLYYENYGIPRIGGKILGLLLVAEEPISAEQISKALNVSRGSVSTNLRLLVSAGIFEKHPRAGDRTDYYTVSDAAWDNAIRARIQGFIELKSIIEKNTEERKENSNRKLTEILRWTDVMIDGYKNTLEEWEKRK